MRGWLGVNMREGVPGGALGSVDWMPTVFFAPYRNTHQLRCSQLLDCLDGGDRILLPDHNARADPARDRLDLGSGRSDLGRKVRPFDATDVVDERLKPRLGAVGVVVIIAGCDASPQLSQEPVKEVAVIAVAVDLDGQRADGLRRTVIAGLDEVGVSVERQRATHQLYLVLVARAARGKRLSDDVERASDVVLRGRRNGAGTDRGCRLTLRVEREKRLIVGHLLERLLEGLETGQHGLRRAAPELVFELVADADEGLVDLVIDSRIRSSRGIGAARRDAVLVVIHDCPFRGLGRVFLRNGSDRVPLCRQKPQVEKLRVYVYTTAIQPCTRN